MAKGSSTATKGRGRLGKVRELPARFIARWPWLRRRYANRLLKMMKRYRAKGKKLPEDLSRIERQIRSLPPATQKQTLERLLEVGPQATEGASRAMRRATERNDRRSGKKGSGQRPGLPPGSRQRQR